MFYNNILCYILTAFSSLGLCLPQIIKDLVTLFPVIRDWIVEFLDDNKDMTASMVGRNMLIEQVTAVKQSTWSRPIAVCSKPYRVSPKKTTINILHQRDLMGLLQLRFEHDSSTIRVRFEHDSATTRYEMCTIRARFEHDTTSYEELCAFEQ